MIYPIVIYGDDVLRKACEPVPADYPDLKKLIGDMFATLNYHASFDDGAVWFGHGHIKRYITLFFQKESFFWYMGKTCLHRFFKEIFKNGNLPGI